MKKRIVLILSLFLMSKAFSFVVTTDPQLLSAVIASKIEAAQNAIKQINNTISMIENQYRQIQQGVDAVKGFDWEEFGNEFKVGRFTNPTEAIQAHLDLLSNIKGKINSSFMTINGNSYSIADLVGLGDSNRTFDNFLKEGPEYVRKNYNKLHEALTKTLSEAERIFITEKTGLTPEQYAVTKELDRTLRENIASVKAMATDDAQAEIKEYFENTSPVLESVLKGKESSPVKGLQAIALLNKNVIDSVLFLNKSLTDVGDLISNKFLYDQDLAKAKQEKQESMREGADAGPVVDGSEKIGNSLQSYADDLLYEEQKLFKNYEK